MAASCNAISWALTASASSLTISPISPISADSGAVADCARESASATLLSMPATRRPSSVTCRARSAMPRDSWRPGPRMSPLAPGTAAIVHRTEPGQSRDGAEHGAGQRQAEGQMEHGPERGRDQDHAGSNEHRAHA